MVVFIHLFNNKCICIGLREKYIQQEEIRQLITNNEGYPSSIFRLEYNGHKLGENDTVPDGSTVQVLLSLPGGKGGFGSMLRAIGAQIEKTTNREACRDLSGRRLRDINEEQRLKRWVMKQAERERQAAKRRRARLERLKTLPKHDFQDPDYDKQRAELPERIDDALSQGLSQAKEAGPTKKRKSSDTTRKPKKTCLWLGIDGDLPDSDASASGEEDSSGESSNPKPSLDNDESKSSVFSEQQSDEVVSCDSTSQNGTTSENSNLSFTNRIHECKESEDVSSTSTAHQDDTECANNDHEKGGEGTPQNVDQKQESNGKLQDAEDKPKENIKPSETKEEVKKEVKMLECKPEPLDLMSFTSIDQLKELGLDALKGALMALGMKCGGTLDQRAERLWSVRGMDPKDIHPSLLSKPRK